MASEIIMMSLMHVLGIFKRCYQSVENENTLILEYLFKIVINVIIKFVGWKQDSKMLCVCVYIYILH